MTSIEIRQEYPVKLGLWPVWFIGYVLGLFGLFIIAGYALALGVRFAVQDPQAKWSDKFSVGYSMTDLRVYEPLRSDSNGFGLQKTLSDGLTQNAYCRGCYARSR